ncbi:ATP-dependent DNA helicase PIF1 [Paramuricea clavata]|uniref:ATP-dependent DNA helicase n=1 Tax=Paramuricea clavata TaxID=317549 RepID=A0A7D9JQ22_PARCT|nr:ATP-dependent DNA helicase PIF1 [Paramuricea clavata]
MDDTAFRKLVRSLNKEQKLFFYHVLHSVKVSYKPLRLFLSGGTGVGKSWLTNALYEALIRYLNSVAGENPDDVKVVKVAPTGKAAFQLPANRGWEYCTLNSDRLNTIRSKLRNLKIIFIDEISMVGSGMFNFLNLRLQQILGSKLPFGGVSFITVGDLFQLQPVFDSNNAIFSMSTNEKAQVPAVDIVVRDISEQLKQKMKEKIPNDPTKTMGLYSIVFVTVGAKYDLTSNVSVLDGMTNGTECTVCKIDYRVTSSNRPSIIWVLFSEDTVGKSCRESHQHLYNAGVAATWTPILEITRQFKATRNKQVNILLSQFPIGHRSAAKTIHRCEGDTLDEAADINIFVETALCSNDNDDDYSLEGFDLFRNDIEPQIVTRTPCGSAIYIKNSLDCIILPFRYNYNKVEITITVINHPSSNGHVHIVGIYLSPTKVKFSQFIEALDHLQTTHLVNQQAIIFGDFNVDLSKNSHEYKALLSNRLQAIMDCNNDEQTTSSPKSKPENLQTEKSTLPPTTPPTRWPTTPTRPNRTSRTNSLEMPSSLAIAYLHNLSPIKESEKKNSYFNMKLQTRKRTYRAVCFDSELHDEFNTRYESSSPIKIANCQMKVSPRSNFEEILINKRSRILDPNEQEVDFDIDVDQREPKYQGVQVSVHEIKNLKSGTLLDVFGRITFQGEPQFVNIRGNKVKMEEAVITDDSATVRLVLWEADISKIESHRTYYLKRAIVKDFSNQNYITLNKQTEISESQRAVKRVDENVVNAVQHFIIPCPPEGVQSVHRYVLCKKCRKVLINSNRKLVKCSACGLTQLKSNYKPEIQATAFFIDKNGTKFSILLRDGIIQKLFQVYKSQTNDKQHFEFDQLTDEDILEIILSISEVNLTYNNNNVAQDVIVKQIRKHHKNREEPPVKIRNLAASSQKDDDNLLQNLGNDDDDSTVANINLDEQLD